MPRLCNHVGNYKLVFVLGLFFHRGQLGDFELLLEYKMCPAMDVSPARTGPATF